MNCQMTGNWANKNGNTGKCKAYEITWPMTAKIALESL